MKTLELMNFVFWQRDNRKWVLEVSTSDSETSYSIIIYSGRSKKAAFRKFAKCWYKDLLETHGDFDRIEFRHD